MWKQFVTHVRMCYLCLFVHYDIILVDIYSVFFLFKCINLVYIFLFLVCVQFFPGWTEGCGESETLRRETGYRPDGGEDADIY